jgi:hypothetical protein
VGLPHSQQLGGLIGGGDGLAIDLHDHLARLQPGHFSRAVGPDLGDQRTVRVPADTQRAGERRRQRLQRPSLIRVRLSGAAWSMATA